MVGEDKRLPSARTAACETNLPTLLGTGKEAMLAEWKPEAAEAQDDDATSTAASSSDAWASSCREDSAAPTARLMQPKARAWVGGVSCMGYVVSPTTIVVAALLL